MEDGLPGARTRIVMVHVVKDRNTEPEHVHHQSHQEMDPIALENHSRHKAVHCPLLAVNSFQFYCNNVLNWNKKMFCLQYP